MKYYTKASLNGEISQREKQNFDVAYRAACESIVLLENDGALPLKNKTVALFGNGAKRTIKGGTGSGEVNERHSVNILEGLENAGFTVTTHRWINDYDELYTVKEKEFNDGKVKKFLKNPSKAMDLLADFGGCAARKVSDKDIKDSNTDTCIYVIARQAGEGVDRRAQKGDLYLTDEEYADIKLCAESYDNFVLLINAGSQIDMKFAQGIKGINAIMFICQLGTAGGNAVADTLSGKVNPSGKLADTWAKTYSDIPFYNEFSYLNGNLEDEYYKEDIYVGYRYFDSFNVQPAYCFGYGKSYTEFAIITQNVSLDGTKVTASVNVKNIGDTYSGKEVVQLYISAPNGKLNKEYQSLAAFAKTKLLAPDETEQITLSFDITNFASYDEENAQFILEKGEYAIRIGNSSRNTAVAAVIELDKTVVVSQHQNVCPVQQKFDTLSANRNSTEKFENTTKLLFSADAISTKTFSYKTPPICDDKRVTEFMSQLSVEDMVEIVVGIGMFGGEKRFDMPGSVGNTTSKFWDKGLANVTLCDGPAGLRIAQKSALTAKGNTKMIDLPLSAFRIIPKAIQKFILADESKSKVLYQYTTAFPVSAALAQTFNTDIVYETGNAVYREMKEYGCVYWLAPALNIHRNPLCGRNFEYYSEDPLLTGEMAAAMCKGVQQEDGFYVTIKHFAANNQEDNRKRVSSNVSERALREIYLRGFEKAVTKGNAKAVMTSYNRLNGVYTPNSYDLCTKVLRNEWGFGGVVMTDWFSTSKDCAENALCMKAGNDLIMPGGKTEKKDILKAVKDKTISEQSVKRCCANVIKYIFDSQIQKEYIDNK